MADGRRAANLPSDVIAWSRSKSGGGVDGPKHAAVGKLDPHGVPGEEHPAQRVVQPDVVLGVAG